MKNLISIRALGHEGILQVLELANRLIPLAKAKKYYPVEVNPSRVTPSVFELFLEKSLRTWGSFATAAKYLGLDYRPILGVEQTSMPKGESFANTVRMLTSQQGADALVIRTQWEGAARFAAEVIDKIGLNTPVINGGDGCNRHPSQVLLDLLTIKQLLGRLADFTICLAGDLNHSRVCHDLLEAARIFGFRVGIFSVPETRPPKAWLKGVNVAFESENFDDLKTCDVLYLFRLQKERIADPLELQRVLQRFQITRPILDKYCRPEILVMHAQPIDQRGCMIEQGPGIYDDPRIIIHKQAWFGLPARMAVLALAYAGRDEKTVTPASVAVSPMIIGQPMPIAAHLERLKGKGKQYFRPIENGTLIDHLPVGFGGFFWGLLKKLSGFNKTRGPVILADYVSSRKMPDGKKDVLILNRQFLPDSVLAIINFFAPEATINIFRDKTFTKLRMPLPEIIPAVLPCPNPDCITNNDPEAETRFWTVQKEDDRHDLLCDYCERVFTREEILRKMKP